MASLLQIIGILSRGVLLYFQDIPGFRFSTKLDLRIQVGVSLAPSIASLISTAHSG